MGNMAVLYVIFLSGSVVFKRSKFSDSSSLNVFSSLCSESHLCHCLSRLFYFLTRNAWLFLHTYPERNRPLERLRRGWWENVKTGRKRIRRAEVNWTHLTKDRSWLAVWYGTKLMKIKTNVFKNSQINNMLKFTVSTVQKKTKKFVRVQTNKQVWLHILGHLLRGLRKQHDEEPSWISRPQKSGNDSVTEKLLEPFQLETCNLCYVKRG
jgi:hypothetical protein